MSRVLGIVVAGLLVVLATAQAALFALLPSLNYWRDDIEQMISGQFAVPVQLSEVGMRLSLQGPYMEALDVVIEQPTVRLELRRLRVILDPWASWQANAPVVSVLAIDEGSAVVLTSGSEPASWSGLQAILGGIQGASERIGAARIENFRVIASGWSLSQLDAELVPGQGVMARARLETEALSLPIRVDWRFARTPEAPQEVHWAVQEARLPIPLGESVDVLMGVNASGTVRVSVDQPITGSLALTMSDLESLGLSAQTTLTYTASSMDSMAWSASQLRADAPGIRVDGPVNGQWTADRLDLAVTRIEVRSAEAEPLVTRWLPDSVVSRLVALNQPNAALADLRARWSTHQGLMLSAAVETAAIQAGRDIPALGDVQGTLFLHNQSGWFDFSGPEATFALPTLFPMDWTAHQVSGRLAWAREPEGLTILGRNLRVAGTNQDVRGELLLDLPRERQQGLQIELQASADQQALPGLLPTDLDRAVSDFLLKSLQVVSINHGRIHYSGPLGPTNPVNRRELVMDFPVTQLTFQPLAEWPALITETGRVQWSNQRVSVDLKQTDFGGLAVSAVAAQQDRLDPRLIRVQGQLIGGVDQVVHVLDSAGVKPAALGRDVILSGQLSGTVDLRIPLEGRPEGTVKIQSEDARVAFAGWSQVLTEVQGALIYQLGGGLSARSLSARLLGEPISVDLDTAEQGLVGTATGRFSGEHALALAGIPAPAGRLSGQSDWVVSLRSAGDALSIRAKTTGVGLVSQLPMPLDKPEAETVGPIEVDLARRADTFRIQGRVFDRTAFDADLTKDPLVLSIQTSDVDLLGFAGLGDGGEATNVVIAVESARGWLGETPLDVASIRVERTPRSVMVQLLGESIDGTVARVGDDPVTVRLNRIQLPEGGDFLAPPGEDPLVDLNPGTLPPLAVAIESLYRGEKQYERIYLDVRPGPSRLDVNNLSFVRDGQLFTGELAWEQGSTRARSALILRAQGPDLGQFLRVNAGQALLEAKRGQLTTSLQWAGSPLAFSPLTAAGEISLTLGEGRFLELGNTAEVLRLFGILNIETLTRRLRLDFLDLVKPGVAFDAVEANARLNGGVLSLNPALEMQGPASSFRLIGDADLKTKTLKQRLSVDIPLTGNLPLASVLLGAPQIGGAIYFVEKAFGTKIIQVGKTHYAIEGPFADPQIQLIPPFTKPKETPNAQSNRDPQ